MADMNFGVNLLPVTTATYSIGSSSKKWQINGVSDPQLTDTTYSNLTAEEDGTAMSLVTTGEKYIWNHIADDKVLKDGDMMTGDLFIRRESPNLSIQDGLNFNDNTFRINLFLNSSSGTHGLWSSGYFDGTTFTSDPKSMIYRNSAGEVIVNGRASDNVLKSGDTITGALNLNSYLHAKGPIYIYPPTANTTAAIRIGRDNTSTTNISARIAFNPSGQITIREYPTDNTNQTDSKSELYSFPAPSTGLTSQQSYNIITTKNLEDIIVASGTQTIGTIGANSGGNVTVNFSPTLSDTNYIVIVTPRVGTVNVGVQGETTSSFSAYYRNTSGNSATANFKWAILKL